MYDVGSIRLSTKSVVEFAIEDRSGCCVGQTGRLLNTMGCTRLTLRPVCEGRGQPEDTGLPSAVPADASVERSRVWMVGRPFEKYLVCPARRFKGLRSDGEEKPRSINQGRMRVRVRRRCRYGALAQRADLTTREVTIRKRGVSGQGWMSRQSLPWQARHFLSLPSSALGLARCSTLRGTRGKKPRV